MRVITTTPLFPPPPSVAVRAAQKLAITRLDQNAEYTGGKLRFALGNTVSYLTELPPFKGFSRWRRLYIDSIPLRETTIVELISLRFLPNPSRISPSPKFSSFGSAWNKLSNTDFINQNVQILFTLVENDDIIYTSSKNSHEDRSRTKSAKSSEWIVDGSWQPALAAVETSTET